MMSEKLKNIPTDRKLYAFELDDILYPYQDYILQIYYLFGSFYEFTEGTVKANDLAHFMKKVYMHHGEDMVFDAAKEVYGIDEKYKENLERLKANGILPLRLELYEEAKQLLLSLLEKGKQICVLTKGNPVEQLNKLKFFEWGALEQYRKSIKIYFVDELLHQQIDIIPYLAEEFTVNEEDIFVVH